LLHYRKLNPWLWAERGWATKGDHGLQYVDTPYGRLGLLICDDINFEPPRLKEAGVDLLLYSIAWVDEAKSPWFKVNLPRIARNSSFHIVGANWSVRKTPQWSGYGHSLVIDSTGRTLAKARSDVGEEIVYADLPVLPQAQER
jgi:predicted amidohydrolase